MYISGPKKSAMKHPAVAPAAAPEPAAPAPLGPKADLLVFGYACKIFRDDEMARYQERGRHLIPWMGDPNTLIDRYDGRGHLHDLSDYDAEHTSWNRNYHLSEEEARIETLCDEERYLALHTDLLEEEARQEEEYKRLSEALAEDDAYNSVGFCYNSDYYDPSQPTEEEENQKEKESVAIEESEEPFIAPLGANVPSDVELPPTAKMHAIIERTAKFVCLQGAQFEIMLKTKQARNSQFDFLRFDHYLYPYYKHIVKAMKEGRYTSYLVKKEEEKKRPVFKGEVDEDEDEDDEEYDDYLHPSLSGSKKCSRLEELIKPLNVMDPDHPLAALVRKAQSERNNAAQLLADTAAAQQAADKAEAQQVADKAEAQQLADNAAAEQQADSEAAQAEAVKFSAETSAPPVYYSYYVLPDGTYCLAPPPTGVDAASYYSHVPAGVEVPTTTGVTAPPAPGVSTPPPASSPGTTMAATVTPASTLAPVVAIIPPPPDIQPVIDKLAQYVSRNGIKFETSVRAKNDPRFDFLQPWHEYNPYYEFKKQFFLQKEGGSIAQEETEAEVPPSESADGEAPPEGAYVEETASREEEDVEETDDDPEEEEAAEAEVEDPLAKACNDGKMKVSFAPISFAIRAKENDMLPLEKNRVKLYDDSEDEEEGQEEQNGTSGSSNSHPVAAAVPVVVEEKKPQLTPEEIEAKQAKQRLEDRLAAAAREKLAQAAKESRDKQLQAERKRKAALFLQTLKNPLELECDRVEECSYSPELVDDLSPEMLDEDKIEPITEYSMEDYDVSEYKVPERPSKRLKDYHREVTTVKEKKKKKHKKRSRSKSRSPKPPKHQSTSKSKSKAHVKAKHSLPSAYRTVRQSRSRSRSPPKRHGHTPERRDRREDKERNVPSAYRNSNNPGISRRHSRSRSPQEKKKKKHSRSHESRTKSPMSYASPSRPSAYRNSAHSASVSPVESRGSSQERYRGVSQEKDGQISSAIVSSTQSKITQDLMAKVRAMIAASKKVQSGSSWHTTS
ncbi:splicing factor, suppressor of white-apricot homolog isoform X2 [Lissotriton helveticus]